MEKIRVFYDKKGNTLTVWFDNPEKEYICEETGAEVVLIKDKENKVIGFEKLNFLPSSVALKEIPFETKILVK